MNYIEPRIVKIADAFLAIGGSGLSKPDGMFLESLGPPATYATICAYEVDE